MTGDPGLALERTVVVNGLRLHCVEWGQPDAAVVIALHGLRSYARTFESVAEALTERYRVVAIDQRGRGSSDWDPEHRYDTLTYVSDLEGVVDALKLDRFHLLGHSMGGANAIVYAARHPDRVVSLVIEDMGPGASASSAGADRIRRELAETPANFSSWEEATAFWRRIRPNVTVEAIESRVRNSLWEDSGLEDGTRIVWRHDQEGIAHARLTTEPTDLWPYFDVITSPVLLMRGADSDFLSNDTADAMQVRKPTLERVDVAGAGHYVHDDQPDVFGTTLSEFLARHGEPL